jgi:hypothetical protein
MINEQLRGLLVDIETLTPDPRNARDHSQEVGIEALKASLEQFGQQKAIVVDKTRRVIAGNGLLEAAKSLGWARIAAVVYDGSGSPDAFALADNRTAELSEWDTPALVDVLRNLRENDNVDLSKLGWGATEIDFLLANDWKPPPFVGLDGEQQQAGESGKIQFGSGQWETVQRAIAAIRIKEDDPKMPEASAIEYLCADYLAGAQ